METIQVLQRRIKSTEDLHAVVRTMKTLAAVNIRQYERAVESLGEYDRTVRLAFHAASATGRIDFSRQAPDEGAGDGLIVFGADLGLSGKFDTVISEYFFASREKSGTPRQVTVLALGERLAETLRSERYPIDAVYPYPSTIEGITPVLQDIIIRLEEWRETRNLARIEIMHNRPAGRTGFAPSCDPLFPPTGGWIEGLAQKKWESRSLPMFTLEDREMAAVLVRQYLFVTLYRSFAESLAAENAARLAAMQVAENNIGDTLEELRNTYNNQSQGGITAELLDIVSGYEALRK